jgi:hypothetical protein
MQPGVHAEMETFLLLISESVNHFCSSDVYVWGMEAN